MVVFQVVNNIAVDIKGGGAELFAIRLLEQIHELFECHLVVVWQYHSQKEIEIVNKLHGKIQIHFLYERIDKDKISFFKLRRRFKKLIYKFSPEIINSHSALPDLLNASINVFHLHKIHSVRTMHTDIKWIDNFFLEQFFINWIFPLMFDREISISKATKDRLEDRFLAKLTKKSSPLIYNGIPDDLLNFSHKINQSKYRDYSTSPVKIISVGRLSQQKGYEYLLHALKLIGKKVSYKFFIVGDGPQYNALLELSKSLGLDKSVEFLGFKNDVLEIMAQCQIFVSSSLWEGFPTVLLEAMAIGLPVIATNVSGSRELIINNKTGLLVPVKNPEAIAKAIINITSDPELSKLLVSNAKEMVKKYTMKHVATRYINLYRQM